eukprot:scaffold6271_cov68-Phaeocystis_antarctica.AAC.5
MNHNVRNAYSWLFYRWQRSGQRKDTPKTSHSSGDDWRAPRARDSRQAVGRVHSPPSSDYRSGSSLAAQRRAFTGREVFIAPWPPGEELQVPSCHPYEVRARGSERSRRVRFGTGPGPGQAFPAGKAAASGLQKLAVAPAKTFLIVGRGVVARARALATVLTALSIFSRRFKGAPGARCRSR